jgi:predicted kinase
MRTLIILKGLPASGKSTYAKDLLKKESGRFKRINRDDLRAMLDDGAYSKVNEEFVRNMQIELVRNALSSGFDVVLDNTHLVQKTLMSIHNLAAEVGDVKVIEKSFNTSVEDCIKRNEGRQGSARVPEKVIHDMARAAGLDRGRTLKDSETYYEPRPSARPRVVTVDLPKAIMCDLDGTLAIIGDRSPYDASRCDEVDIPNEAVIACVKAMYDDDHTIIFMSGRDSKYREQTKRFIEKHCIQRDRQKMRYELHMRGEGDTRNDAIVKRELYEANVLGKFNVEFVLDDRNRVVDEWRRMGIPCFQVNPGNF